MVFFNTDVEVKVLAYKYINKGKRCEREGMFRYTLISPAYTEFFIPSKNLSFYINEDRTLRFKQHRGSYLPNMEEQTAIYNQRLPGKIPKGKRIPEVYELLTPEEMHQGLIKVNLSEHLVQAILKMSEQKISLLTTSEVDSLEEEITSLKTQSKPCIDDLIKLDPDFAIQLEPEDGCTSQSRKKEGENKITTLT